MLNKNFPAIVFLHEIELQCGLITHAEVRLRMYAAHWVALDQGTDDGMIATPVDIVATCTVCLSAAASISKLLFVGKRAGKKASLIRTRCSSLITLLGNPKLPVIESIVVRNAWEHLDERLDDLLSPLTLDCYLPIHVSATPPADADHAMRHFDPIRMEIKHWQDTVSLALLIEEAKGLLLRISNLSTRTELGDIY